MDIFGALLLYIAISFLSYAVQKLKKMFFRNSNKLTNKFSEFGLKIYQIHNQKFFPKIFFNKLFTGFLTFPQTMKLYPPHNHMQEYPEIPQ